MCRQEPCKRVLRHAPARAVIRGPLITWRNCCEPSLSSLHPKSGHDRKSHSHPAGRKCRHNHCICTSVFYLPGTIAWPLRVPALLPPITGCAPALHSVIVWSVLRRDSIARGTQWTLWRTPIRGQHRKNRKYAFRRSEHLSIRRPIPAERTPS